MNTEGLLSETLCNGIELPVPWPPNHGEPTGEPMPVPYLDNPPMSSRLTWVGNCSSTIS